MWSARLLALARQGRQDVRQGDAEVVFLGGLKHRVEQLVGTRPPLALGMLKLISQSERSIETGDVRDHSEVISELRKRGGA